MGSLSQVLIQSAQPSVKLEKEKKKRVHLINFIFENTDNIEESSQNQKGKNSFIFSVEFGNF